MTKPYQNATDILPEELLREVQQYHTGLLYVPRPGRTMTARRRAELIVYLHERGVAVDEIARLCEVTTRRVYQVLRKQKNESFETD